MNNSKIKLASTLDANLLDIAIPCEPCDCDDESSELHFDCVDVAEQRGELYDDYLDPLEFLGYDPRDFLDPKEYMTDEEYKEYLKRTQDEQPQDTARTSSDDDWKDMPF